MDKDEADTEYFISVVQKYPYLWDMNHDDYKNKALKNKAWIAVCRMCYKGYDEKSEGDKILTERRCILRWKNLRDNYCRSTKKSKGRKYIHAKLLSFLSVNAKPTAETDSLDDSTEDSKAWQNITEEEHDILDEYEDTPTKKMCLPENENPLIEFVSSSVHTPTEKPATVSEDMSFFHSLMPMIENFTVDQKIEFRLDVLNIIKKIRNSSQTSF